MRETQMFEEIWKEFQREISEEQAFSLSLLMAFSWHYGEWQDDFGLDIGSGAMVSQGSLIESIKGIQGYDVREAFSRLSERINWQMVEQEAVQRLLKKMIDCFVWYGKKGEDPREVFALIHGLDGAGRKMCVDATRGKESDCGASRSTEGKASRVQLLWRCRTGLGIMGLPEATESRDLILRGRTES